MESATTRYFKPALIAMLFVAVFLLLGGYEHDLLARIEERSLFTYSDGLLKECLRYPAGPLLYVGRFLTQFLYYPWLGALLTTLLLAITARLAVTAFNLHDRFQTAALLISALLLAADMCMGYTVYTVKSQGWFFMGIIGYMITLLSYMLLRKAHGWKAVSAAILWSFIGYLAVGVWALLSSAALIASTATEGFRKGKPAATCTSLILQTAAAVMSPLLCSSLYTTARKCDALLSGLHSIPLEEGYIKMWMPLFLLAILTLLFAVTGTYQSSNRQDRKENPIFTVSVILASIFLVWFFWFRDANFRAEMKMAYAAERDNWRKVTEIHRKTAERFQKADARTYKAMNKALKGIYSEEERVRIAQEFSEKFYGPTRTMVLLKNVAMLRLGTALSEAYSLKDGGKAQKSPQAIHMATQVGMLVYSNYGMYNYSYRWAMENAVEYGWSPTSIRFAAESQILAGNYGAAEKMLGRLDHTLFHRKWASEQRQYINDPEQTGKSSHYGYMVRMGRDDNWLDSDRDAIEHFLMSKLTAEERPANATPEYDTAVLLWALQSQDIPKFWMSLFYWKVSHPGEKLPRYCQEAAYMYCMLEGEKISPELEIDPVVQKQFEQFMQFSQKQNASSAEEARYPIEQKYGRTYFYYYYFIRNLKSL